jgi:hypothetical protein
VGDTIPLDDPNAARLTAAAQAAKRDPAAFLGLRDIFGDGARLPDCVRDGAEQPLARWHAHHLTAVP